MGVTILLILYVFLPVLAIYLCQRYEFLNRVGTIVMSYVIGVILGLLGASSEEFYQLQDTLMNITVPIAIPLMLFTSNVKAWKNLAVKPLYSLLFALLAVLIAVISGYFVFKGNTIPSFNKVAGMLVGIFSGGTPNLASLKLILDVDEEVYLAIHSYDMVIGAVYLFVIMGFGQKLFGLVLPKFVPMNSLAEFNKEDDALWLVVRDKVKRKKLLIVLLITLGLIALAGGIMMLVPESAKMVVFIFLITAFGIGGSSFKKIHQTEGTFDLGMYLILIFSIVVASKASVDNITNINPALFGYITFVIFVSLILHVLLARFKKVDVDTVLVTSAALICSPPFVPVVAGSLRNREIIVPGLTVGLIGYALGNYLGYAMAMVLSWI
ncbi:DUF819 family protein [Carboxylicivirga linearis]|uniref:DUF819 family protein n=1 Tax=Carboxylicivirga linearis TaxID=1628157 RepID=A0ABS5K1H7_9BACT|nr:DUF819 family protein [Carboxylicivirga linearis]MBS2100539.1 DUF819 family protein [Carboxylicivirga linearis]